MGRYLPFAGRNAIAEMTIGIQFAIPFGPGIGEHVDAIRTRFESDFPKYDPVQAITLSFGSPPLQIPSQNAGVTGFSLTKIKADGTPARLLRVAANSVSVHFTEYTSWAEIKPKAITYILECLSELGLPAQNPAMAAFVGYVDRFTFDGAPEKATANALFQRDTKFVAARIFDSGDQWHSNSGWFQDVGGARALNNLNVSSVTTRANSSVTLDHNSVYTYLPPLSSLADLTRGTKGCPAFEEILDVLHRWNADLLKNLLNREMLDTIGLKV
jgi:uncharacterized protein (TIGR04255 family)